MIGDCCDLPRSLRLAATASMYLRGKSSRKPHDRRTIRAAQPDYYKFLDELFDPEPGDTRKAANR